MSDEKTVSNIGESRLIEIVEEIIHEVTGKSLVRDDSFFFNLNNVLPSIDNGEKIAVFNSDMFVSSTDAPFQMDHYQMGKKSIVMNVSDVIVKGIVPKGIIISLGLPKNMRLEDFKNLMKGIVDRCKIFDLEYIIKYNID